MEVRRNVMRSVKFSSGLSGFRLLFRRADGFNFIIFGFLHFMSVSAFPFLVRIIGIATVVYLMFGVA